LSLEKERKCVELQELLDEIDAIHPNVIGLKVSQGLAAGLVRAAFQVIHKRLRDVDEGRVAINGLGVFYVRKVAKGEGAGAGTRKIVIFGFPGIDKPAGRKR
jgi:hypothetical protein